MKVEKTEKKGENIQKEEEEKKIGKKNKKRSRWQLEIKLIKYVSFNIYQPHKSFSFLDFFRYINKLWHLTSITVTLFVLWQTKIQ